MATRHLYIHVPFCRAKCDYCDFASQAVAEAPSALLDGFVEALLTEWEAERRAGGVRRLHTVYLGGGTPSLLGVPRLERILAALAPHLTPAAEVTVEANPEDVDDEFAGWAAARGVRVPLGVQSFSAQARAALGRRAVAEPVAAYRRLRDAGVRDLGIDLIFGTPGQTMIGVAEDLAAVSELVPDHVSWYELEVVADTPLGRRLAVPERRSAPGDGTSRPPAADARAEMYRRIVRDLRRLGLRWYEVSNFARPGHRCRHNVAVWRGEDHLGLGPGAVGTIAGVRRRDLPDAGAYIEALTGAKGGRASARPVGAFRSGPEPDGRSRPTPHVVPGSASGYRAPPCELERLDPLDRLRERVYLAARSGVALDLDAVSAALDMTALEALVEAGFVRRRGGTLRVTRKGRYVADDVCVRLFRASHVDGTA